MSLRELPESEMEGESDERWRFETQQQQWEQEAQEDKEEGLPDHTL